MKKRSKYILTVTATLVACFLLVSMSCNKLSVGGAQTVFADSSPAVEIPEDALAVAELLQTAFRSVSSQVLPAVVKIDTVETRVAESSPFGGQGFPFFFFGTPEEDESEPREYSQEGLGSGVIVRRTGNRYYVLTNDHVVGSATEISVTLHDNRDFEAELVGTDSRKDIALVSFESNDDLTVAKLGDSDIVQTGDIAIAMGSPLGYFESVTQGIISATGRSGGGIGNISDFLQTDAAINQGNSGGPLVNIYGEVIGINTWIASSSGGSQGLGFAIPINNVKSAIDAFITDGRVTYGWMGVSLVEVTDVYKEELEVNDVEGAFVAQIFLNSPAAKSGIQAGDYITALNGKDVRDVDQLVREVGDLEAGKTADFELIRGGRQITVEVRIEERDEDATTDNSKLWPGFVAAPLTDEIREELDADGVDGIVVTSILAKSPAAALRLQSGDIITAVNDVKVETLAEFYNALDTTGNDAIWFDVYSDGSTITTGKYNVD